MSADNNGRPEAAHPTLELDVPDAEKIERVWRAYWLPLLVDEHNKISLAKLKAELYDAFHLVNEARKVYRHVTGGVTDDLTVSAEGIIATSERKYQERAEPLHERIRELEAVIRSTAPAALDE